jgi:hypothetical protein
MRRRGRRGFANSMTASLRRRGLAAVMTVLALRGGAALAQQGGATRCAWVEGENTHSTAINQPNGISTTFIGGGVVIRCPSRNITLVGDSAEVYNDKYFLVGHVRYEEPRLTLTSDFLTYFPIDERVVATVNVNARLPSGSTLVGQVAEYRRAIPGKRPRAQISASSRPTITVLQKDSVGKAMPPMTVVANTVFMDGDSLLYGGGQVTISRENLLASGDSAFLDTQKETMKLMRKPRIEGNKQKPFTLTGDLIDLFSRNRKLEHVISHGSAVATSQDMNLKADTIDLRVSNDLLEQAIAWGKTTRAHAVSSTQNVVADSIIVTMPKQRVRIIHAVERAFAEGKPDTTRFRVEAPDTTDWIMGDTIVAMFDTLPPKDTTKSPDVQVIVASGGAKSQYHFAPSDTSNHRPAISYVVAREITIDFDSSRVALVTAKDSVAGLYLEPSADSTTAAAPGGQRKPQPQPQPNRPVVPSIVPLPRPPQRPPS